MNNLPKILGFAVLVIAVHRVIETIAHIWSSRRVNLPHPQARHSPKESHPYLCWSSGSSPSAPSERARPTTAGGHPVGFSESGPPEAA